MNSTAGLKCVHSLLQEDTLRAWFSGKPVELQPSRNLAQESVPVFLVLILVELAVSCLLHEEIYQWRRTFSNLAAGLFVMLAGVWFKSLNVLPYALLHRGFGWRWDGKGGLMDGLAFLLADLGYYCFHRFSHATNLGWSAHVTHHSSPDYNLSTALRQGAWEQLVSWAFYLPMALLVPPHVMLFYRSLNTTLQFWVHTQLVRSLGPLELVLNTPSHHRVHHARNYRSANYGGVFIVWDRMFGTFEPELAERPCVYGLDDRKVPLDTHNPLWHQLHQVVATARMISKADHPLALLFSRQQLPPAMEAASTEIPGRKALAGRQRHGEAAPNLLEASSSVSLVDGYVAAHFFGAVVPASLAAIGAAGSLRPVWTLLAVFGNFASLSCLGLLLDGDPPSSSRALETARLLVLVAACHLLRHLTVLPRSFPCDLVLLASALSIALVWSLGHRRLPSSRKTA